MPSLRKAATAFTIILLLVLFAKSLHYTFIYGGTDLRGRIIGSRLSATDHSPYFYKWNPPDGEYYLDPNEPRYITANSNTVTPATLYTFYPLATLPYKAVRLTWTILQFIMVFAIVFLLSRRPQSRDSSQWLPAPVMVLLFLVCSDLWLYNIERGQIYIFYTFLFSLMYWLYHLPVKHNHFLSGLAGGLFIFYRPMALVAGIGVVVYQNYKWLMGAVTGLVIGALLFVAPQPDHWRQYFAAMKEYSLSLSGHQAKVPETAPPAIPGTIEHTNTLTHYKNFQSGGMGTFRDYLAIVDIGITHTQSLVFFAVIAMLLAMAFMQTKRSGISTDRVFLFGFLLYLLLELFTVAPRAGYSAIQWIFPLFIAWKYITADRVLLCLYLAGVLFFHQFPFYFAYQKDLAEALFILVTSCVVFTSGYKRVRDKMYGIMRKTITLTQK